MKKKIMGNNDRRTGFFSSRVLGYQSSSDKGFTMIEIMIVVIIIASLAAMVIPRLSGRADEAKVAIAEADIRSNISMALKMYELDNVVFPTTEQGLDALLVKPSASPSPPKWKGPYLERSPLDPWGKPYQYRLPGEHNISAYDLYSLGKDGAEGTEDDIKNWE